jgi:drug/metabolite transporter (DMT)-like permease
MLSLVTIVHIYTSYRGFELLESGVAYSIFYLYPIMILLMSGHKIQSIMLLAVLGVYLLASKDVDFFSIENLDMMKVGKGSDNTLLGVIMIGLAAFTEAVIYFLVRDIKTMNNWNHIFISYFLGAILLTWYFLGDIKGMKWNGRLSMSLGINSLIGLIGYLLRFYAVSRLDTMVYAPLSYFGIVMSFVYGIFINGESIDLKKIVGAGLIIFSNLWLL